MHDAQDILQTADVHASSNGIKPGAKDEQQEPGEEADLGPGMFDEDAANMMSTTTPTQPKTLEDLVGPWGGYGTSKKKKGLVKSTCLSCPCNHLQHACQMLCCNYLTLL